MMKEYLAFFDRFFKILLLLLIAFSIMGVVAIALLLAYLWLMVAGLNMAADHAMVIALFLILVITAAAMAKEGMP